LDEVNVVGTPISTEDADANDEECSIIGPASSKISKGSRSPTKRMVDLKVAEKKIVEKNVISSSDLPFDAQSLYLDIQTIGMTGCGSLVFTPHASRLTLQAARSSFFHLQRLQFYLRVPWLRRKYASEWIAHAHVVCLQLGGRCQRKGLSARF
jgi:hypothetical protein